MSTKLHYAYNTYKFRDHSIEELEQSTNPLAAAVIAVKYANEHKNDPNEKFNFKQELMTQIINQFSNEQEKPRLYLYALFYFIDYLLKIPKDLQQKLEHNITDFVEKEEIENMQAGNMEASPTLAAIFKEYERLGLEKGMEKGMEEGVKKERKDIAKKLIHDGFSDEKIMELTELSLEEIESLKKSLD
ncbi:hypothetical protein ABRT01_18040 [Lentibacillus sp. L22]|uniref:hypothetical protein n=1 Tax=Lentibacillus sp. L22 TaxID=3163028 RepID=UPI0034661980